MSKIRIKIDEVEVEYEGSDSFLKDELPALLDKVYALAGAQPASASKKHPNKDADNSGGKKNTANGSVGTTSSIAADFSAKTGPDLALAAGARLAIGLGRDSFTRDDLLTEMKSATTFYQKNYSGNLTKMLVGLVKAKKFREISKDTYSLSAATKTDLEARLGS